MMIQTHAVQRYLQRASGRLSALADARKHTMSLLLLQFEMVNDVHGVFPTPDGILLGSLAEMTGESNCVDEVIFSNRGETRRAFQHPFSSSDTVSDLGVFHTFVGLDTLHPSQVWLHHELKSFATRHHARLAAARETRFFPGFADKVIDYDDLTTELRALRSDSRWGDAIRPPR